MKIQTNQFPHCNVTNPNFINEKKKELTEFTKNLQNCLIDFLEYYYYKSLIQFFLKGKNIIEI